MISSILNDKDIGSISVVGNGPVSQENAGHIDEADLVLRFNRARSCGAAGRRVDVLAINRARVYMCKRINPVALHRAREVWVNDREENGRVDWLFEKECKPRYLGFGPIERARKQLQKYAETTDFEPTTGACIIAELLEAEPQAQLRLFGFTHQGMHTHDLNAEKSWVDDLVREGRIQKFDASGAPARRPLSEKAAYYFRFAEKNVKHYIENKILHSDRETKDRIFGR
ncbi:hypothetical protein [Roseibium sp. MMSF_3544]|uniref:hypothetical protein n=1 Tax=unclassified Roseibium TaxID=2629323 RepID=UPI00273D5F1B|nr:hypothetical protein [Roseibium sp. MMSF_3544]